MWRGGGEEAPVHRADGPGKGEGGRGTYVGMGRQAWWVGQGRAGQGKSGCILA